MDIAIAAGSVIFVVTLGAIVYWQNRKKIDSLLFLLLTISLGLWILFNTFTNHHFNNSLAINVISNHFAYLFGFVSVATALAFTYVFPIRRKPKKISVALLLSTSVIISVLSFTDLIAGEVQLVDGRLKFVNGELLEIYGLVLVVFIVYIVGNLYRSLHNSAKIVRLQARLVMVAFVLASITGALTNILLPLVGFNFEDTTRFAPLAIIILALIIAYTIARHRLFDVRSVVVRSSAYGLSLITLAALYYILAYSISITLLRGDDPTLASDPTNIVLALVLAFVFQPVKQFFDRITNGFFYRNRYRTEDFYAHLSEVLTTTNDLKEMLRHASHEIKKKLKTEQAFFIVAHGSEKYTTSGTSKHHSLPSHDIHMLNIFVEQYGDNTILTQHLDAAHSKFKRMLVSHKVELIMPLVRHGAIVGYLALGEQLSTGYTPRDIKVLRNVSDEMIIAIQNALSVQEVKDINANLEQRIETATSALRRSNARLKRLDETKDEFISMASHQLRTPLTSIKGYLSMMLEGDMGKITPMQKQVLDEAFTSSERMVHLIHDFLNVSRLQTGKFMLEMEDTDLAGLIADEVESLSRVAKSRDIAIEFTNTAGEPCLHLDDNKIRQVVMNFIDNAIYYSHPDTTIKVMLAKKADTIVFTVKDTGIGVPKNEQAQLFGKFYRASNARKQRPDGTGVGIYLAKKVIVAHGGDVLFESKPGKGSLFGFKLPIQK
jgi:signal transduction histidine kinase